MQLTVNINRTNFLKSFRIPELFCVLILLGTSPLISRHSEQSLWIPLAISLEISNQYLVLLNNLQQPGLSCIRFLEMIRKFNFGIFGLLTGLSDGPSQLFMLLQRSAMSWYMIIT